MLSCAVAARPPSRRPAALDAAATPCESQSRQPDAQSRSRPRHGPVLKAIVFVSAASVVADGTASVPDGYASTALGEQRLPCRREGRGTSAAFEQAGAEPLLQRPDLFGQRGLADVQ